MCLGTFFFVSGFICFGMQDIPGSIPDLFRGLFRRRHTQAVFGMDPSGSEAGAAGCIPPGVKK